jgi:hypothetical protein
MLMPSKLFGKCLILFKDNANICIKTLAISTKLIKINMINLISWSLTPKIQKTHPLLFTPIKKTPK